MDPCIRVPGTLAREASEFVRFCRDRRRVGWPELYDEMWAVASRRLFRGYGFAELPELGEPVPAAEPTAGHGPHLVVELRPTDAPPIATEADELGGLPGERSGHTDTRVHQSLLSSAG